MEVYSLPDNQRNYLLLFLLQNQYAILHQKDAESTLKNGENAYVDEYFTVKGLDQYGEEYGLDEVDITWNSDNEKAFRFENNKVIAAVEAGRKRILQSAQRIS